jgi:uncharacterized membrane protein
MDSRRAESFSDGVFAVAITLLVIDLLSIGHGDLSYQLLGRAWPQYAAYVVSFLTIGIMWLNHHTMVAHIRRVDRTTLVLNLLLLMGIVALPFPTALVAEHLGPEAEKGGDVAAAVYGGVMVAISIAFAAMWTYIDRHRAALGGQPITQAPRGGALRFTGGLVGYAAGTLIADPGKQPGVAVAIYGALAVYYLFDHLPAPPAENAGDGGDVPAGSEQP